MKACQFGRKRTQRDCRDHELIAKTLDERERQSGNSDREAQMCWRSSGLGQWGGVELTNLMVHPSGRVGIGIPTPGSVVTQSKGPTPACHTHGLLGLATS